MAFTDAAAAQAEASQGRTSRRTPAELSLAARV